MGEDFVDWPNRAGFGWVRRSCTGCSCGAVRCHAARRTSIGCRVFVGPVAFSSTDRLRTTGPTHLGPHPRTGHTAPAHSNTDFVPGWGSGYGERLEQVTGDGGDQLARVVDAAGVELVTGRGFVSLLEGVQVRTGVGDGESPAVMGPPTSSASMGPAEGRWGKVTWRSVAARRPFYEEIRPVGRPPFDPGSWPPACPQRPEPSYRRRGIWITGVEGSQGHRAAPLACGVAEEPATGVSSVVFAQVTAYFHAR
jgi:hypothetical protein